jgi:hypothetical protein
VVLAAVMFGGEGGADGASWLSWTAAKKLGYIQGAAEAVGAFPCCPTNAPMDGQRLRRLQFPFALKYGEIEVSLDLFYVDQNNRVIPIAWALEILATKTEYGSNWEQMKTMIESFRRTARQAIAK